ncbi:MAG TPA: flagellar basal body rod protein FlgB [Dissulfurispiraceae bacterium]|nr:flagellar basal body rod protein FlgB [Dissulfurispiraceae bacterium]
MPDDTFKTLENIMDIASFRQKVLTSNIANADTPGYRAKDISFQTELDRALGGARGNYQVFETMPTMINRDGNTVSIDSEMTKVAENHLIYSSAAQILAMKFRMMKDVAKGGGQ